MTWLSLAPQFRILARVSIVLVFVSLLAGLLTFFLGYWQPINKNHYHKTQCIITNTTIINDCVGGECQFIGVVTIKKDALVENFTVTRSDSERIVMEKLAGKYRIGSNVTCYSHNDNLKISLNSNRLAFIIGIILFATTILFLGLAIFSCFCVGCIKGLYP